MASRAQELYTQAVVGVGTIFILCSAYNLLAIQNSSPNKEASGPSGTSPAASTSSSSSTLISATAAPAPAPRPVADSAVSNITYIATLEDCQTTSQGLNSKPKLRAGSLLKLIDVAAGVAARRRAKSPCVTVSVDSVLFLKPIFLGDLIHLSASVNRTWGSSMEIGVKVSKSDAESTKPVYVSHSYLTFVAVRGKSSNTDSPPSTNLLNHLWRSLIWQKSEEKPAKIHLAPIQLSSRLEARRHLLAGRRRSKRIEDAQKGEARDGVSIQVKNKVRNQVLEMLKERDETEREDQPKDEEQRIRLERRLRAVEIEFLIRAWALGEDGILVQDGKVHVNLPGDESFHYCESEIRATAKSLGVSLPDDENYKPGRRLSTDFFHPSWIKNRTFSISSTAGRPNAATCSDFIAVEETITTSMHLVFHQHINSQFTIFGGNTMSWSEEVALMACRNILVKVPGSDVKQRGDWKTVAMDGLEFKVRVAVGE